MRTAHRSFLLLAGLCLTGCVYYPQPASPPEVSTAPPPYYPPPVANNYVSAPVVQETQYQPPPPDVAPVYEDDLAPYGRWVVYGSYGRCWIPNNTPYGWQPYTVGHWVYADDGSCYWVSESDEVAWGGIVYHYGQWAYTADDGWLWVPGTTYAPAWVAWRDGGGYCGWAPLPPEACYQGNVSYVVADRYCPPQRYVYVQEGDVNVTRVDERVIRNNTTIINNTTNITNITVVNNRVVNNGVPAADIQRRTGRQIERVNVADAGSVEEARRLGSSGVPVRFSTPAIQQVSARSEPTSPARNDRIPPVERPRQIETPAPAAVQNSRSSQVENQQKQAALNRDRELNGENNRGGQFDRPAQEPAPQARPPRETPEPREPARPEPSDDRQRQNEPDRQAHPANADKPRQKEKPKPGEDPDNGPPH